MSKLQIGDYVTTCYSSPIAIQSKFEIEEIRDVSNEPHGVGKYGAFPLRLLKKTRRPKIVKKIKSVRQFMIGEEINHPKFGKGTVIEVTSYSVRVLFESGKNLNFLSIILD